MAQDPGLISGIPVLVGQTINIEQPATLQGQFSNTCTATKDFAFAWKGVIVNFWANETTVCDAALLAALLAQSAPITTP